MLTTCASPRASRSACLERVDLAAPFPALARAAIEAGAGACTHDRLLSSTLAGASADAAAKECDVPADAIRLVGAALARARAAVALPPGIAVTSRRAVGISAAVLLLNQVVGAVGLSDAIVALRTGLGGLSEADRDAAVFHDDEIDGPLPERVRTFVLTLDSERAVVAARVAGVDDVDIVGAEDVPDIPESPVRSGRPEQQLAMLAVRLEMAATYLRLVRG